MNNCNSNADKYIFLGGCLIGAVFIYYDKSYWVHLIYGVVVCCLIYMFFAVKVYYNESGVYVRYIISLGRNKFANWEDIVEIADVEKGVGRESGTDIHIVLKDGSEIKFSPIGIKMDTVDILNAKLEEIEGR